jgi:hypothetical protein
MTLVQSLIEHKFWRAPGGAACTNARRSDDA